MATREKGSEGDNIKFMTSLLKWFVAQQKIHLLKQEVFKLKEQNRLLTKSLVESIFE